MKRGKFFNKKYMDYVLLFIFILFIFIFLLFIGNRFTGFAVFDQTEQASFNEGVYNNTEWYTNHVRLSSGQTSGTYTSKIFDAEGDAVWNNISWSEFLPTLPNLLIFNPTYAEDESGKDITSKVSILDGTDTWERVEVQVWNDTLFSDATVDSVFGYCDVKWIDNGAQIGFQVSRDNGTSWDLEVCVQDAVENTRFECDLKANSDVDTVSEINNLQMRCTHPTASQNDFYSTDWAHVEINYTSSPTDLKFQSRSDEDNSSWSSFIGPDGTLNTYYIDFSGETLNVSNNQYFQYKAYFLTDNSDYSPELYNVSIDYTVLNSAPAINLIDPQNQLYTENESLALNYIVYDNDDNLDSCWYNIDGETNIALVGCANTTFDVAEGSHNLAIYANDSLGLESSDFVEFNVDASGISLLIIEPTGTKTSRIGISLNYNVTSNNVSCWYNVQTSVGGGIIENTTLENCSASSFSVSTDGDYVLNLYANNSLGTSAFEFSSFSVDTSSTVVINSGGGGGGSSTIITGLTEVEVGNLSSLIVYPGDSKKLSLKVKNTGTSILNDCFIGEGGNSNFWISSSETKNLASGEIYSFVFNLIVSDIIDVGKYDLEILLQCQEINQSRDLIIEIIEKKLDFEILNVERIEEEKVKVEYSIEELSNINQEIEMQFLLFDSENKKVAEIKDVRNILANSKEKSEILIPIESSLEGEMRLLVNLNSETYSTFVQEDIILGAPISGLSVFGNLGEVDKIASIFLVVLFLIAAFFLIRRILGHKKKLKKKKRK